MRDFYSSSLLDHVANTCQDTALEIQLARFNSGATSLCFPFGMVQQGWEIKVSDEQPGALDPCCML